LQKKQKVNKASGNNNKANFKGDRSKSGKRPDSNFAKSDNRQKSKDKGERKGSDPKKRPNLSKNPKLIEDKSPLKEKKIHAAQGSETKFKTGFTKGPHKNKPDYKGDKKKGSYEKKASFDPDIKKKTSSANKKYSEEIRLNRYLAIAGICSRREADDLIKAGVVKVNGEIILEMGYKVQPGDVVNYGGQTLKPERHVYVLLNKPKDFITTRSDPQDRRTVMNLIAKASKENIYPVGRLDRMTTGLLLFTNDGELTRKLTHPSSEIEKIYHVFTDKVVKYDDLKKLQEGIELDDGMIKADKAKYVGNGEDKKQVGVELHSGRNRIVRRMFEHLGYRVIKLDRVVFAGLTKKDLPRGKYRLLTEREIATLKML
jgi:23S rRNA pseudouridine2605 synthase